MTSRSTAVRWLPGIGWARLNGNGWFSHCLRYPDSPSGASHLPPLLHFKFEFAIPQAREIAHQAEEAGQTAEAEAVRKVIEDLLNRPEHTWYEEMKTTLKKGVEDHAAMAVPGNAVVGDVAEAAQADAAKVDTIDSASSDGDTAAAASPTEPITPSTESR